MIKLSPTQMKSYLTDCEVLSLHVELLVSHYITQIVIETGGVFGQDATALFKDLGQHLRTQSHSYLVQQIAVTVQRGSTAAAAAWNSNASYPCHSS